MIRWNMPKPKTSARQRRAAADRFAGAGALAALGLGALALLVAKEVAPAGEYETWMGHPDTRPEGDGWVPMNAVTHTSLYGGLKGRPVARVVWRRRVQPEEEQPARRPLFALGR